MDRKIVFVISAVWNFKTSERNVAYSDVKEIVWEVTLFKAGDLNVSIRIKKLCNAPWNAVLFNCVNTWVVWHWSRHFTKEISCACRRIENRTTVKPHIFKSQIYWFNNERGSIKGIKNWSTCGIVFFVSKETFKLWIFRRPLFIFRIKSGGQSAPANVSGKYYLFFRCCRSIFLFNHFQRSDSFGIRLEFRFSAAFDDKITSNFEVFNFHVRLHRFFSLFNGFVSMVDIFIKIAVQQLVVWDIFSDGKSAAVPCDRTLVGYPRKCACQRNNFADITRNLMTKSVTYSNLLRNIWLVIFFRIFCIWFFNIIF